MALRTKVPASLQPMARNAYTRLGAATPGLRMLPEFIVIGGQRCGTTSLFKALAVHPQLLRPAVEKGIDYFSLHYSHDLSWYRGHFPLKSLAYARRGRHGRPVAFEACTYYAFHPFAMERIAKDLPDVKLIFMLREPVERAFSAYKHEFARGFETASTFDEALALEDDRLAGETEKMRDDLTYESFAHRHHGYRHRGNYAEQLERVYEHFPRERVHVAESEAFFADPVRTYGAVLDFLDIERVMPRSFDQHNARPGSGISEGARSMLKDYYGHHAARLEELLGRQPQWLQDAR